MFSAPNFRVFEIITNATNIIRLQASASNSAQGSGSPATWGTCEGGATTTHSGGASLPGTVSERRVVGGGKGVPDAVAPSPVGDDGGDGDTGGTSFPVPSAPRSHRTLGLSLVPAPSPADTPEPPSPLPGADAERRSSSGDSEAEEGGGEGGAREGGEEGQERRRSGSVPEV